MSRPFKLYRLQMIDSHLDWAKKRLHEIQEALEEDKALRHAIKNAEQEEKDLQNARKALRQAEDNVQSQQLKIEGSEATLYSGKVRNPKELQDLENEVEALKRYLSVLEDRQLEAMLEEEKTKEGYRTAKAELEQVQTWFSQKTRDLTEEREKHLRDVDRYDRERQAACSSIPDEDLFLYSHLRQKSRGIAVAKVTDNACEACGSTLNAALLHATRSPNQITQCDKCGRILYHG